jgi:ribulose-phosphate 3-epimerase
LRRRFSPLTSLVWASTWAEAERAGADRIHVDAMDGSFVPNLSMGPAIVESLRKVTRLPLETHLMVVDPDLFLDEFAAAGSDSFVVHWEGNNNLHRTVQRIKALGKRVGVAINPATPAAVLEDIVPDLDLVLVNDGQPGVRTSTVYPDDPAQDPTRARTYSSASSARAKWKSTAVSTRRPAPLVVGAGATVLVAGSSIFGQRESVTAAMTRLQLAITHQEHEPEPAEQSAH